MTSLLLSATMAAQLAAAAAAPAPAQAPAPVSAAASPVATHAVDGTAPLPAIEVVVYSDFQCPFCAMFSKAFRDAQANALPGVNAVFSFKHYPLPIHPRARLTHQASLAAAEQGKFWEMHDLLFANQGKAQRADLIEYARTLGLDVDRFLADMDSDRIGRVIDTDVAEGEKRGINGTPTFYVNGKQYVGTVASEQLKLILRSEQRRLIATTEISDDMLSRGPAQAPVTIEFYADLQSTISRSAQAVLNEAIRRYPTDVRVQFRNFPLAFHPQATLAHEAAMTAAREGKFWEFSTYVLNHQDSLREQDLIALAGRVGLDAERFAATLRERRYAGRVESDLATGSTRGIRGSPVLLVNGRRIDGVPSLESLIAEIEAARAQLLTQDQR